MEPINQNKPKNQQKPITQELRDFIPNGQGIRVNEFQKQIKELENDYQNDGKLIRALSENIDKFDGVRIQDDGKGGKITIRSSDVKDKDGFISREEYDAVVSLDESEKDKLTVEDLAKLNKLSEPGKTGGQGALGDIKTLETMLANGQTPSDEDVKKIIESLRKEEEKKINGEIETFIKTNSSLDKKSLDELVEKRRTQLKEASPVATLVKRWEIDFAIINDIAKNISNKEERWAEYIRKVEYPTWFSYKKFQAYCEKISSNKRIFAQEDLAKATNGELNKIHEKNGRLYYVDHRAELQPYDLDAWFYEMDVYESNISGIFHSKKWGTDFKIEREGKRTFYMESEKGGEFRFQDGILCTLVSGHWCPIEKREGEFGTELWYAESYSVKRDKPDQFGSYESYEYLNPLSSFNNHPLKSQNILWKPYNVNAKLTSQGNLKQNGNEYSKVWFGGGFGGRNYGIKIVKLNDYEATIETFSEKGVGLGRRYSSDGKPTLFARGK